MKVGDAVRDTIDGCVGIIIELAQDGRGLLVYFAEHNRVFYMVPWRLEEAV